MSLVKTITSDAQFTQELAAAATNTEGSRLVVVDFFATWCQPCQQIAPFFNSLSTRYPHATFLKVDCDQFQRIAQTYQVRSMPTFLFIRNNQKIGEIVGAKTDALEAKIKEFAGEAPSIKDGDSQIKGQMDLTSFINQNSCECLNSADSHPLEHAFNKTGGYLESDCDEQLVIYISFNQTIRLHSLKIVAPPDNGPKTVRLYINQPSTPDFDACENTPGTQDLELTPEDLQEGALIPLKYVKFQTVNELTIFVKDNQSGSETTQIQFLGLIGNAVNTTNMSDFKRVAGKKGEVHA